MPASELTSNIFPYVNCLIDPTDTSAWEQFYDRYAAVMYGIVCRLVEDRLLAGNIFIAVFQQLKNKPSSLQKPLLASLIRFTYAAVRKHLSEHKSLAKSPVSKNGLVNMPG